MSAITKLGERVQARRALLELEAAGFIKIEREGQRMVAVYLLDHPWIPPDDQPSRLSEEARRINIRSRQWLSTLKQIMPPRNKRLP